MFKFWTLDYLYSPEGDDTGGGAKLSINDMIDNMAEGDDDKEDKIDLLDSGESKEKKDVKEEKDEKDEKDEKIELEEDEDEEPTEEELDNVEDVPRKAILKKYPTIFKDFPQLERSYYREQKYAELLPTLDDAKEAVEKAEQYTKFSESILSGDMTSVISSLKTTDEKAYEKLVDNYMPSLGKVDQQAYYHIIGNVVKDTIATMIRGANKETNEDVANNLKAAAIVLNKYFFGTDDYTPPAKFAKGSANVEESEEVKALRGERESLAQQKFEDAVETLGTKSANVIRATITQHIDPKDSMTDYVKRVAIRDAMDEVDKLIEGDKRFKGVLNNLWKKAAEKGFSRTALDEIQKTYLSKAKTLLPPVIQKHRNAALKGLGRRVTEEKDEVIDDVKDEKEPATRRSARADNTSKDKAGIPKGMSSLDYLNSD